MEMLVVISIIGLLSSIVVVNINGVRAKARDSQRVQNIHAIALALQLFFEDHDRFPDVAHDGVSVLGECIGDGVNCGESNVLENLLRPYLDHVPADPLHNCEDVTAGSTSPYEGALEDCLEGFFYAYDASHALGHRDAFGDCQVDFPGDTPQGSAIISINRLETMAGSQATCLGADMNMNTASYNFLICSQGVDQCGVEL